VTDLVETFINIEGALEDRTRPVVQLASMGSERGSQQTGFNLAWIGASILGKRVLLLTAIVPPPDELGSDGKPVDRTEVRIGGWAHGLIKVTGHEVYVGDVRGWRRRDGAMVSSAEIDRQLDELSTYFDMIVIAPPPLDRDPLGMVLARHAEGHVIVIEAEDTRRFAAVRLREILARSNRPIIGAILTNRRNYLPRWLARVL
jgi:hypothetical protein